MICWGGTSYGATDGYAGGDAVAVSAGLTQGCALRTDGSVRCWGQNQYYQAMGYTPLLPAT